MQTSKKNSAQYITWLMILPVLLWRGFTTIYPVFETVRSSFYDINLLRGKNEFVGFGNFVNMVSDPKVLTSIEFTAIFTITSMILHIILGVVLALVMNMEFRGRRFIRTIVLIPWAMPMIVIGMAAKWAFNNEYGLINDFIRWFNPSFQLDWLIHKSTARFAVIAVDVWKDVPFFAVLLLSALQFIPDELYESARVDGAGPIRSFVYITLPLISKTILVLAIPFTMWRMTAFDLVYAMTSGGPGEDTALIAYRITTEAFTNLNIGYASALALALFFVLAIFSLISSKLVEKHV